MLADRPDAAAGDRLLRRRDLIFEPKYDGIRALVALDGAAPPGIYSRLGRDKTPQFPDLIGPLSTFARRLKRPALLDGEIVATSDDGAALPFQRVQPRLHATGAAVRAAARAVPVALVLFDLLRDGDEDVRALPLTERRKRLERVMRAARSDALRLVESAAGNGVELAARARAGDWEGVIAKRPASRYASGRRSSAWLKLKFASTEEFVVGGWTSPRGSRRRFGALLLGYYPAGRRRSPAGKLVFAGQAGSGFTGADLDRIAGLLTPLATDAPPFVETPPPRPSEERRWVEPAIVVQASFSRWTLDGLLLHPVYAGLRDDKRPADVRLPARRPPAATTTHGRAARRSETQAASPKPRRRQRVDRRKPDEAASPARPERPEHPEPAARDLLEQLADLEQRRRRGTLVLSDGSRVPVSNLHKVFWPESGATKGDLIRFHLRMAPYLLPVVAGRPLVMKRFPDGVAGPSFHQHRAPDPLPAGVDAAAVPEAPGKPESGAPCLIGGRLGTLLYMAQLAVISQDPWFSTVPEVGTADTAALDLDPTPGCPFARVLDVARWVHDELEKLGAPSFPKTSGASGLHVVIPLPAGTPFEAGMIFCRIVATVVAARRPAAATVERAVRRRRPGVVYVDCLQNVYGKTLAAAYSARASAFAGVSTPLTWAEAHEGARSGLEPGDFTIRSIFSRLDRVGDLWAALRTSKPAQLDAAFAYGHRRV